MAGLRVHLCRIGILWLLMAAFGVEAEIRSVSIRSDPRPTIAFGKFGFSGIGRVEIAVSDLTLHSTRAGPAPDPSLIGFFLGTEEELVRVVLNAERQKDYCVFKSSPVRVLLTLNELHSTFHNFSDVYVVLDANEYGLFYTNCQPHVRVSLKVRISMYNIEDGGQKSYLPLGQTKLPAVYSVFSAAYLILMGLWAYVCVKQKSNVHKIHVLMLLQVVLKVMNLVAETVELDTTKRTGTPHGWDVVYYLFSFLRGIMVFTVIILIGTGWSILKPFLQEREKTLLMIIIPLQVLANIAAIVIDETGPSTRDWITWKQLLLLVDIICCCAVLFPIVWSIKHLREASRSDGKAARNLVKLTLFRQFYVFVVSYIYFTRIVVFALLAACSYRDRWVAALAREAATLAFYIFTGYKFRPVERNPYISMDEEQEEETAEAALKDEDFEL